MVEYLAVDLITYFCHALRKRLKTTAVLVGKEVVMDADKQQSIISAIDYAESAVDELRALLNGDDHATVRDAVTSLSPGRPVCADRASRLHDATGALGAGWPRVGHSPVGSTLLSSRSVPWYRTDENGGIC